MSERKVGYHDISVAIAPVNSDTQGASNPNFDEGVATYFAEEDSLCDHKMNAVFHSQVGPARCKESNSSAPDHP